MQVLQRNSNKTWLTCFKKLIQKSIVFYARSIFFFFYFHIIDTLTLHRFFPFNNSQVKTKKLIWLCELYKHDFLKCLLLLYQQKSTKISSTYISRENSYRTVKQHLLQINVLISLIYGCETCSMEICVLSTFASTNKQRTSIFMQDALHLLLPL